MDESKWTFVPKVESLVCLEVPGKVENPDRIIKMVGGIETLVKAFCDKNRRLELRFRPEDPHCKPACGERVVTASYLVRVKVFKRKQKNASAAEDDPSNTKLVPEIVAPVSTIYKFHNLCDFQYLPVVKTKDSSSTEPKYESILQYAELVRMEKSETFYMDLDKVPLFLPPAVFSRMDAPQDYHFRRDVTNLKAVSQMPQNIIGRTRQRRTHHTIFVMYDAAQIPDHPKENACKQMMVKFVDREDERIVKEKFEKDPVWSKNALVAMTSVAPERLKFILPTVAYYFTTGPWRNFWVRFGYDPRKDRAASQYQSLDYRVRVEGGITHKVKAKRNYASYLLPYKGTNWSKPKTSLIQCGVNSDEEDRGKGAKADPSASKAENLYLFKPGMIPPYRQMFYMYKDILVPEAQQMMVENLKPENGSCDEKNGWFNSGLDGKLREILTREIKKVIHEENAKLDDLDDDDEAGS